ncbi:MAG: Glu/Leu/Phe/Val dehydrogenase dimerization domain-containing protein [Sphingopyxis sp.]|uniref:Leu/Phe/Val dehydrogenase n=1 Tax=Sphingopyxis sp. TaxID=1908224 RepID=UPI002ABB2ADD|nr:Glu/Leu/Phe/Val dehydrogenase dimerization domain-containing protein [Sphingopyxis sp.]MDZ3832862.1 Glu/Leu/Phe/Val dehydrogenase dimerization domain-containing protein [Sphingopyxis sp.]
MVARPARLTPPLECVRLFDADAQLDGIIAIHSTALGPGAGGCRFWSYPDMDDALDDALRLAEGMSYKNALAGLPFGGAKAVLRRPEGDFDRAALFRAFGRAVEALGGLYVTAEDVGTTVADMQEIAGVTRHVAGLPPAEGRAGGDPSPWTARGVFESMRVAAGHVFDRDLGALTVAVQGTGNVGADLCRRLAEAGAQLIIADPNPARRDRLQHILGARVVDVADIAAVDADIFAPCALGGALTDASVDAMKARLVCGAANNQLAAPDVAARMLERGITYVPDYVANAGGIISVSAEYLGEDEEHVAARVGAIAPRVATLLERAAREKRSPALVADEMAEEVIANAGREAA